MICNVISILMCYKRVPHAFLGLAILKKKFAFHTYSYVIVPHTINYWL